MPCITPRATATGPRNGHCHSRAPWVGGPDHRHLFPLCSGGCWSRSETEFSPACPPPPLHGVHTRASRVCRGDAGGLVSLPLPIRTPVLLCLGLTLMAPFTLNCLPGRSPPPHIRLHWGLGLQYLEGGMIRSLTILTLTFTLSRVPHSFLYICVFMGLLSFAPRIFFPHFLKCESADDHIF